MHLAYGSGALAGCATHGVPVEGLAHAASRLAVYGAKMGFGLNYFHAKMSAQVSDRDQVKYESRRTGSAVSCG